MADAEYQVSFKPLGESKEIILTPSIVNQYLTVKSARGIGATAADVRKFLEMCAAQALNPWLGDAFLIGYDNYDKAGNHTGATFSLVTSHQAILKRAEASPQYDGMRSGVVALPKKIAAEIGETGLPPEGFEKLIQRREGDLLYPWETVIGGWAEVKRKDRDFLSSDVLEFEVYSTGRSRWLKDPAGMIVKCFDSETEVLTDRGFQKFAEVSGKILQVDSAGLTPVDSVPFVQAYSGPMILNENQNLDFCVTPNHDMVTTAGKIEAGEMYRQGRLRPKHYIPRCIDGTKVDANLTDEEIQLAAVFACDGSTTGDSFVVAVSRVRKIAALAKISRHSSRWTRESSGDKATLKSGRTITTKSDKECFRYPLSAVAKLIDRTKRFNFDAIVSMSRRQAALFVSTMIGFDGSTSRKTNVRRFYSSRPEHIRAMEIAVVLSGQSVSDLSYRENDGKKNYYVTVSSQNEIPVRKQSCDPRLPSMVIAQNEGESVWCVTVPSGMIIVRRHGFSMVCGNCAEASAQRKAFPSTLGALYIQEEMESVREGRREHALTDQREEQASNRIVIPAEAIKVEPVKETVSVGPGAVQGPATTSNNVQATEERERALEPLEARETRQESVWPEAIENLLGAARRAKSEMSLLSVQQGWFQIKANYPEEMVAEVDKFFARRKTEVLQLGEKPKS